MPASAATHRVVKPRRGLSRLLSKAPIYIRDARAQPAWAAMFVLGRFTLLRVAYGAIWRWVKRARMRREEIAWAPGDALAPFPPERIAATVEKQGLCRGLTLTPRTVDAIRSFAETSFCYAGMDRRFGFHAADHAEAETRFDRPILVAHFLDDVMTCDAARDVIENPWLRRIAADYIGAEPTLIASRLWWSFPSTRANAADLDTASQGGFHYDLDDWRQIKFFFYLTDVDADSGVHVYAAGSHRRRPLRLQWKMFVGTSRESVARAWGEGCFEPIAGPAGTGFAEDPFGFHMGEVLRAGRRLILEVSYGTAARMPARRFGELTPPNPKPPS